MKVGVTLFFQNYQDWDRYDSGDFSKPADIDDTQVYKDELALGDLIEPLGFDSLWTVEHHHTPYTMIPDPTQLLSYFAGRTSKVDMGTMVMVLPWHHPLHVAENIALLDNLLAGRKLTIGFGRGASAKEFDPIEVPMEESRELFMESLQIVKKALTNERFSFEGKHYTIPETSLRPGPLSPGKELVDNLHCSWGSPQTLPIAANAGLGMLFIPMKPWEAYEQDMVDFNDIRQANGWEAAQPTVVVWIYCHEDAAEAQAGGWAYMANYWDSAGRHYGFASATAFKDVKGYEYYQHLAEERDAIGADDVNAQFAETQVYGTPEECIEKLERIQKITNAKEFVGVFSYGGMPAEKAEASLRTFAKEVLPKVQALEVTPTAVS